MSTITKKQAQKIIDASDAVITALAGTNEDVHPESDSMLHLWDDLNDRYAPPEVVRELARIVQASLEAEPVAWDHEWASCITCDGPQNFERIIEHEAPPEWAIKSGQARNLIPLYTATPATVSVPDESAVELLATDLMKRIDKITGERHSVATLSSLRVSIVEACRAAMLQGAENAESRCSNSPVIPDGWVLVPVEPTYQMCEAMGMPWERPRFPDRYKAMLAAAPQQEMK